MIEKTIYSATSLLIPQETRVEVIARIRKSYPPGTTRRMSHLGLYLDQVMQLSPTQQTPEEIIYATSSSESTSLEKYLDSFPYPSPTHFQTSIHPGGIEQVAIRKKNPVPALIPIAGKKHILSSALKLILLSEAQNTVLTGGEESATWLTTADIASAHDFAFRMQTGNNSGNDTTQPTHAGSISWNPLLTDPAQLSPSLLDLALSIQHKTDMHWLCPLGEFQIRWHHVQ